MSWNQRSYTFFNDHDISLFRLPAFSDQDEEGRLWHVLMNIPSVLLHCICQQKMTNCFIFYGRTTLFHHTNNGSFIFEVCPRSKSFAVCQIQTTNNLQNLHRPDLDRTSVRRRRLMPLRIDLFYLTIQDGNTIQDKNK